jgi:Na+/H+-translocating membrane pyrophosphatase
MMTVINPEYGAVLFGFVLGTLSSLFAFFVGHIIHKRKAERLLKIAMIALNDDLALIHKKSKVTPLVPLRTLSLIISADQLLPLSREIGSDVYRLNTLMIRANEYSKAKNLDLFWKFIDDAKDLAKKISKQLKVPADFPK